MGPLSVCMSCLSVLSATLVYCGQRVGWIKMKLVTQVGLGYGHNVLHGDPAPPPQRDTAPNFGPYMLWPNGWMDQDSTWYGGRLRRRPYCATWGPSLPPKGAQPNDFGRCLLWPNGRPSQLPLSIFQRSFALPSYAPSYKWQA